MSNLRFLFRLSSILLASGGLYCAPAVAQQASSDDESYCGITEPLAATDEQIACLDRYYSKAIMGVKRANPEEDANAAALRGEFNFLEIVHAWGGPGLPGLRCLIDLRENQLHGSIFFSDAIDGQDDIIWRAWAQDYVRRFNIAVINGPLYPYKDVCFGADYKEATAQEMRVKWLRSTEGLTHNGTVSSAARLGQIAAVERLLFAGGDVNEPDIFGYTALAWASLRGEPPLTQMLLDNSAQIDGSCRSCARDLFLAISASSPEIVRQLVEHGADVNAPSGGLAMDDFFNGGFVRGAPLNSAVAGGHIDIVQYLLAAGADPEGRGEPPAFYAVENGLNDMVQLLLDGNADIAARDGSGLSLLQTAAERNSLDAMSLLMDRGAVQDARSDYESSLWRRAHRLKRKPILRHLIAFGGNANLATRKERRAISDAVRSGNLDNLTELFTVLDDRAAELETDIKAGKLDSVKSYYAGRAEFQRNYARSGLIIAIESRQAEIAKWYINNGANPDIEVHYKNLEWLRRDFELPNASYGSPQTPKNRKFRSGHPKGIGVMIAFDHGPLEIVELMLNNSKKEYSNSDPYYKTPLTRAFFGYREHRDINIIDAALNFGGGYLPDTNRSDFFLSEVCFWTLRENADALRYYLGKGYRPFQNKEEIDAGFRDRRWENALGNCIRASAEAATLLLDHGADPNLLTRSGQTPLIQAIEKLNWRDNSYLPVIEKLLEKGADPNVLLYDGTALDITSRWLERIQQNKNTSRLDLAPQEQALSAVIDLIVSHGGETRDSLVGKKKAEPYIEPPLPIPVR